ncbi:MAG: nitroreductase family deazaflavin-dependent oxidoreductase [Anaerolineae bacterium]|jgi:deazaflavin-dependent oxidoreductase (nitroreductase family)|nr:nitroreductase family deazaflavin-dependent oxidoreductase [Anaerolineae bacterium]MBT3713240.1 nitroreductase family deazaflavin-dependent oxidoreductase [Anaerolineae bacterium]MBT4311530.1 nitroreductase family deazaflavin-dependent oxidoreductase [Anaerolineae bacterium]MBT4459661.1 nitroreductase family deazaflavin-dependent oxidoreductase [Anaerolineae bacterium]MBT4841582.1 nitroreductase family deazaflavin-dependent oxidoreductase [Anaerolineae bacterium]
MEEPEDKYQRNWVQKTLLRFTSSKIGARIASRILHPLDKAILKASNNRSSLTSLLSGIPVIVLTSIGAKSGKFRTVPLLGVIKGEDVFLIASNWGQARHPSWYYNLRANPEAQLSIGKETGQYIAQDATDAEREAYWDEAVRMYAGYAEYKKRIVTREIPMFVLSPIKK